MSEMFHLENFSIVDGNIKIEINFDKYSKTFAEAQAWLGATILEDCKPFMPHKTGGFQQRSYAYENGKLVVFPGPFGRFQYGGLVMVDPDTGSPWARKGAKKVLTNRPLKYSRPEAVDHWFDEAKAQNGDYWIDGVAKIIGGRRK